MSRRAEYKVLNMRVTPVARELFAEIANQMGVSQTAAFETIVRRVAREDGIAIPLKRTNETEMPVSKLTGETIDWAKHQRPTLDDFRKAVRDIEAMGPMSKIGATATDEDLTREAIYGDHP